MIFASRLFFHKKRRNMKKYLYFLAVFGIGTLYCWYKFLPRNQSEIYIQFLDVSDIVYTTVEIEGKRYYLDFCLTYPSQLKKEVLENVKKEPLGPAVSVTLQESFHESFNYLIPKITMGRARFTNVCVREYEECFEENSHPFCDKMLKEKEWLDGTLGVGLFMQAKISALFFDLSQSKAFLIKNLSRFYANGYSIKSLQKVPLIHKYSGFCIPVDTDVGKRLFFLDTQSSKNAVKSSLCFENIPLAPLGPVFTSSKCVIGSRDFGREEFLLCDIALKEIDGILGISFFKKCALLLDFQNQLAYIGPTRNCPRIKWTI